MRDRVGHPSGAYYIFGEFCCRPIGNDLVLGGFKRLAEDAYKERETGQCGPEGKHFEPKVTDNA